MTLPHAPHPEITDATRIIADAGAGLRVALGHDWLTGMRGGERVLEMFCNAFPDAPISTLLYKPGAVAESIASHPINVSALDKLPGIYDAYRNFLPLMPAAARTVRVPDCDLFITTSHCVAKSFRKPKNAKHICVCFTPMRYAWIFFDEYFGGSPLKAALVKPLLAALRRWDKKTSANVDRFVAISRHVAARIENFYGRDSDIVYPAVDTARCTPNPDFSAAGKNGAPGTYDLIVSALVPYKRVDLAVQLYTRNNWPLKVVGVGGCAARLAELAGPSVELLGGISDADVLALYRDCRMLIFPGEEDYGIVPLEAQACGRPVVAYKRGGALETVRDGVSGVFFDEQTVDSLGDAVARCAKLAIAPRAIRAHAERFGPEQFARGMADVIRKTMKN